MSHGKQFTLYSYPAGPNGWKVAVFLEELGLPYETVYLNMDKKEQKAPEFLKFNPNGRIPALVDHKNNDFVLWESDAILVYLAEKYDTAHAFSASTAEGKLEQLQWLFFQASGQGPYFGQATWFLWYHPEKVPSALERYRDEIKRVYGVLEGRLSQQEYMVGGKLSIVDLAFVHWNQLAFRPDVIGEDFDIAKAFPAVAAWHHKVNGRASVQKCFALRAQLMAAKK